jgi:hypothetical protein
MEFGKYDIHLHSIAVHFANLCQSLVRGEVLVCQERMAALPFLLYLSLFSNALTVSNSPVNQLVYS